MVNIKAGTRNGWSLLLTMVCDISAEGTMATICRILYGEVIIRMRGRLKEFSVKARI